MPLYEYYCADCKSRFEVLTTFAASQAETTVCATCHGTKVRKLLSVFATTARGGDDFGDFVQGADFGGDVGGSCGCGGACSCGE